MRQLRNIKKLLNYPALKHSRFSRANLTIFILIFAAIGGYLILRSFAAGVTSPVGVVFMSPSGSDTAANCRNYGITPAVYPDPTTVCLSFAKLNSLLARGQTGEMYNGSYLPVSWMGAVTDSRTCTDQSNNAVIQPASGATVVLTASKTAYAYLAANFHCLTLDGMNRFNTGSAGKWTDSSTYPNEAVGITWTDNNGGAGGSYNTLKNLQLNEINGVTDHFSLLNSDIGPCAQPNQLMVNNYFSHTPSNIGGCSGQMIGNGLQYIGNKLHDQVCLSPTDDPDNTDWCNPPASGSLTSPTCQTGTCTFYGNGFHTEVVFLRGCTNCVLDRNLMYHSNSVDVRIQNTFGTNPIINPEIINNIFDHPTCNAAGTCLTDTQAVQFDNPTQGGVFSFNSLPDLCDAPSSAPGVKCDTVDPSSSTTPITVVGNLLGQSGCPSSTTTNFQYNDIIQFSQFTNLSACSSALTGAGNKIQSAWGAGLFKYTTDTHAPTWDAHLLSASPGRNLVPGNLCPTVDFYGNPRPQGAGQFCDAGAVQTLTTTAKPGDLNNDGFVNVTDLSILLSHYGQAATAAQGDINSDGTVTIQDLSILLSHYGT